MTGAEEAPIYPQYCFYLSPTIGNWCPLRIADVERLVTHPGFAGQDLFFYKNHPIKWVRISGVVVAIDEYTGRRIYTVDDSSGMCIECSVAIPIEKPSVKESTLENTKEDAKASANLTKQPECPPPVPIPAGLDVGSVVDIKGGIKVFREHKQIKVEKITILRITGQELKVWEKVAQFRAGVLSKPWMLSDKEVRKCRRAAEDIDDKAMIRRARKKISATGRPESESTTAEAIDQEKRRPKGAPALAIEKRQRRKAAAQVPPDLKGKYSALGI